MKKVPSKAMLDWLSGIAPLGELAGLLEPPGTLYELENAFSSEIGVSALSLNGYFFSGLPLPKRIPGYSIAITERGSTTYATIVDKKRRIIVNAPVRASEGYWENAFICLRSALRAAKESGKLIVSSEDGISEL